MHFAQSQQYIAVGNKDAKNAPSSPVVEKPGGMKLDMMSIGTGNTIVELFSAEMLFSVCRYLN